MDYKEDEDLIAKLIEEDFITNDYQEETFINYDIIERQILEPANLLQREYQENIKKVKEKELEERRRLILEQDQLYAESIILEKKREEEKREEEKRVPQQLLCPISNKIMENPIKDEHGISYEKSVLLRYLLEHDNKNHLGNKINKSTLSINITLKQEIYRWKREHSL